MLTPWGWAVAAAGPADHGSHAHAHSANPYAEYQHRPIKALSAEQVRDLQEGRGMGLSLPAELNGSPGPLHVLQMRERLGVTADQVSRLEALRDEMSASAKRLGADIVQAEAELDAAFRQKTVDEAFIQNQTARIGTLNGALRSAHLVAHLKTQQVLTPSQIAAYGVARGYAGATSGPAPASRHAH